MDNGIVIFDDVELNLAPFLKKEKKIEIFLEELSAFLKERDAAIGIDKITEKDGTISEELTFIVDGNQIGMKLQQNLTSIWFTSKILEHIKNLIKNQGISEEKKPEKEKK